MSKNCPILQSCHRWTGNIQGVFNITQDRVESYLSTSSVTDIRVGDSYTETLRHLAGSAMDPAEGEEIWQTLEREKILAGMTLGKWIIT